MSETVLLAGAGDLGQRVAARLLAQGHTVWALRRQPPAFSMPGLRWLAADLTRPDSLRALPAGITQLVYAPTPGVRSAAAYRAVFLDGLQHLLAALPAAALQRVLFVSSSAVYGEHADAWVDEATPVAPPGFNGELLWQAEQWLAAQPLRSIRLRLAGLYGPGRTQLLQRLRDGQVAVPRAVPHWANRLQVDDAASAIVHLLGVPQPQPLYLGVDDTPLPLDQLYDALATLLQVPLPAAGVAPVGIGSKRLSNARLRASGWTPRWPDARQGYAALLQDDALG